MKEVGSTSSNEAHANPGRWNELAALRISASALSWWAICCWQLLQRLRSASAAACWVGRRTGCEGG